MYFLSIIQQKVDFIRENGFILFNFRCILLYPPPPGPSSTTGRRRAYTCLHFISLCQSFEKGGGGEREGGNKGKVNGYPGREKGMGIYVINICVDSVAMQSLRNSRSGHSANSLPRQDE